MIPGLPVDETKLARLVKNCLHQNVFPIYLPSYLPDGQEARESRNPITNLLRELVEATLVLLETKTGGELAAILEALPPGVRIMLDQGASTLPTDLRRLAVYCIVAEVALAYFPFKGILDSKPESSEVLRLYPELADKLDDDGLLVLDGDFVLHDGGIEYHDHVLHYHQLLRRGYTSNPNFDFLGQFIGCYHSRSAHTVYRIALDHRRVMPKEFYRQIVECDTWFGPHFDATRLDDRNATGLTVVVRNKGSLFELTNHLDRTEFFWTYRNGIKTLEIEEISSVGYEFDSYYFNRYVHSERDVEKKVFRHLDGAVKVYLGSEYASRTNSRLPREPRSHRKIKLFRVDGDIRLESWLELISLFYKSNEMIIEYFNPEEFRQLFDERVRDYKAWKNAQGESPGRNSSPDC